LTLAAPLALAGKSDASSCADRRSRKGECHIGVNDKRDKTLACK
jgi:hypothetical protein